MIKSVLVAMDGSEYAAAACDHGIELGKRYGARLVGLHVLDVRFLELPLYVDYFSAVEAVASSLLPTEILESFREKGERILDVFEQRVQAAGIAVDIRLDEGVPAQVIADMGDSQDLILMGKRGEHARWGRDLLGSTTEYVVRRATSPVLLTERNARPLHEMLLLYDGSHAGNHALKIAADLASTTGAGLRVFTAASNQEDAQAVQKDARCYLGAFNINVEYRIRLGKVVPGAMQELEDRSADLILMGMRGHSILHNLILGSTAEQVMRDIESPLLLAP